MSPTDRPIRILAVGGTWSKKHERTRLQWYQRGSNVFWHLMARGFCWLVGRDGRVFDWNTRINGFSAFRTFGNLLLKAVTFGRCKRTWLPSLVDWQVAGSNLYAWICPPLVEPGSWMPQCITHLWLHSHAGNLGFFACADGLRVNVLVTFGTPPRTDMIEVIRRARPNIQCWIHVHSDVADKVAIAGTAGDGVINIIHKFSELRDPRTGKTLAELGLGPDLEIFVDDGHSNILNDPARFDRLQPILDIIEKRHGRTDITEPLSA